MKRWTVEMGLPGVVVSGERGDEKRHGVGERADDDKQRDGITCVAAEN